MKKKVFALVLALVMALSLLPVTAMAEGTAHTHVWDTTTWTTVEGVHWHECIAPGCDWESDIHGNDYNMEKDGYGRCQYDATTNECICGAVRPAHEHDWAEIPSARTTREHWCVCITPDCPLESDTTTPGRIHNALHYKYKPHTFDREGYCAECDWKYTSHVHSYNDPEFFRNDTHHWRVCTTNGCWIKNVDYYGTYAPHTLNATGECADCGYQASKYTVKFNANDGTGTMVDQNFVYSFEQALTANTFTKTGYTFQGWATTADGTVVYADTEAVKNLTATDGATVTLYAVWERNTYNVTVDASDDDGGTVFVAPTALYDTDVSVAITSASGYKIDKVQLKYSGTEIDLTNNISSDTSFESSFTMPAADVELAVEFIRLTTDVELPVERKTYYFVEHYVQEWGGSYTLVETEVLSGEIGTTVTADSAKYDNYPHHVNTAKSTLEGTVSFDLNAEKPMETVLTLKVYYDRIPSYDPTPVIPDVNADIHDDSLSAAAKAVGAAVKSGKADITPVAGYTMESIAQLQKDEGLKLVVEKKASYDPAEKALIDKAVQDKGKAALVQFLEIDVTLRTMNDVIVAEVDDTIVDLTITVDLNAEMQKAAKDGKTIYAARAHDGKVTFIEGTLNAEMTKFTFDSSKFSTYALVAFDSDVISSPKTADAGIFLAVGMSILSVTGSAVLLKKKED